MTATRFEIGRESRLGNRRINQDRCAIVQSVDYLLLTLGDGMGGHPRGEMAAQILMDTTEQHFYRIPKPVAAPRDFLKKALQDAHKQIQAFGFAQTPPIDPRTTGVVVLVQNGMVHWAHVGDSRFYLFRKGKLLTRTIDHSYVEQLRQDGIISAEQQETHPQRHFVTRCLGGSPKPPAISLGESARLLDGDVLLLCSDGFWANIEEEEMAFAFQEQAPLEKVIKELARAAEVTAHPESDNVTALAMRWHESSRWIQREQVAQKSKPKSKPDSDHLHSAIDELTHVIGVFENKIK
jgi:serine/threonine protein phosphatase PrpC